MSTRNLQSMLPTLCALVMAGCYSGVSVSADSLGETDTAASGNAEDTEEGGSGGGSDTDSAEPASVSVSGLSRLTSAEYERTVTAVFGVSVVAAVNFDSLPPDGTIGRFETNAGLDVNIDSVDGYRLVAEQIGVAAGNNAATLLGCEESPECVDAFIRDYGLLIYRRPLNDAEAEVFAEFWETMRADADLAAAMRMTVTALLQTPDFLYRLERGEDGDEGDVRRLTGYEVASRLSFFLWGAGPDLELLQAAEAGELDTAAGIETQTERLLANPRSDDTILRFYKSWLGLEALETQDVDSEEFPEFDGLRDDMIAETDAFILHVFREDDASVSTLLTADYSFASPELAAFYGEGVESVDGEEITLNPAQRLGILTQASYLTAHARAPERAPIYRGSSLLVDLFCVQFPPPPDAATAVEFDSSASARKQIEDATADAACQGCHVSINPLGFLFEHYDGLGRWRTMDGEFPVDAAASVVSTDIDGEYADATELISRMAQSEQVETCISRQWLRFALSRPDGSMDADSIAQAADEARGDMRALVGAITRTDTFRYRRLQE